MPLDVLKLFTSLGLSASESKAYMASLKTGPTSVQEIAKSAKLSRTATYDAIASLQERGLMTTYERKKKRFFVAESPDMAVAHFKDEIRNMEKQLEKLDNAVPELKLIVGGERPVVRFYEGREALYAAFNDAYSVSPKEVLELTNYDDVYEHLNDEVLKDARKVIKQSVKMRILHRGECKEMKPNREYCELLPELGDFHGEIWIYENRVVFVTFVGKVLAVIIQSQQLADIARVLFEAAWRICSPGKIRTLEK